MKTTKQLGIWMDHSVAHLMELSSGLMMTITIDSKPELNLNEADLYYKDDSQRLNKEQRKLLAFFNKLREVIIDYDKVILFGPTDAKTELFNFLKEDHHFEKIKIEMQTTDKMTDNQMQAFTKEYFTHSN